MIVPSQNFQDLLKYGTIVHIIAISCTIVPFFEIFEIESDGTIVKFFHNRIL